MWIKKNEDTVKEIIHDICIDTIGEEYRVFVRSDDGGTHLEVWFEEKVPVKAKELLSSPFKGWRLLKKTCPTGYLAAFFPNSGLS